MRRNKTYLISVFILLFNINNIGQTFSDSVLVDSTQVKYHEKTKSLVLLGIGIETLAIISYYPIPYLGIGHFYLNNWTMGLGFLGSEVGLLFLEDRLRKNVAPSQYQLYPNVSNNEMFYKRNGLDQKSDAYQQYTEIIRNLNYNYRLLDLFSAYRDFHQRTASINKVNMDDTSIPSLMISPFKPKYLTNPWVFVPLALGVGIAYLEYKSNKPLSSANEIMMFNKSYSPAQAAYTFGGINIIRYSFVAAGEEMLFRGVLQTELTENTNPQMALYTSSFAFGLYHLPHNDWANVLSASLIGLYFGYRYQSNGYDLGEVIATHFWFDFIGKIVQLIKDPAGSQFVYSISWRI